MSGIMLPNICLPVLGKITYLAEIVLNLSTDLLFKLQYSGNVQLKGTSLAGICTGMCDFYMNPLLRYFIYLTGYFMHLGSK